MFFLVFSLTANAQKNMRVAFWNLENLYDTINDPNVNDEEFLPSAKNKWNSEKYLTKLNNLSKVILEINPDIIGFAEVENKAVLNDLTQKTALQKQGYSIVHYDSPDQRGIDVAMIYKKKSFRVLDSKSIRVELPGDSAYPTRDILLVKGVLSKKDTLFIMINHWPSRRGGTNESEEKRIYAAAKLKQITDSIYKLNSNAQFLAMGDFNDEPTDKSLQSLNCKNISQGACFINKMDSIKASGDGTHYYKKEKNVLDQILVSAAFNEKKTYYAATAYIFKPEWIFAEVYKNDGLSPKRTYAGSRYIGGYSDHLPVYMELIYAKQ
ncbi:MAG: endonuclease [Bacteroidia bacterium]